VPASIAVTGQGVMRRVGSSQSVLTDWINKNYPGFEHPYGNARGVPQAAFRRAKERHNVEGMDALVRVFTHDDGSPLWLE